MMWLVVMLDLCVVWVCLVRKVFILVMMLLYCVRFIIDVGFLCMCIR